MVRSFRKKNRKGKIVGITIAVVILAALLINVIILPLTAEKSRVKELRTDFDNAYINANKTDVSAHRAGGGEAPEETLSAFKLCMENGEYKVDILEFDLHITKDGELILLHDDTLDRTSDAVEVFGKKKNKASDYTYEEIYALNMGENFVSPSGETPYKGLRGEAVPEEVRVLSLDKILTYLEKGVRPDGTLKYIIEIKDSDEKGEKAMDKLYEKMVEYNILDRTIVGTFHGDVSKYIDKKYGDKVTRSAGIAEVLGFYMSFLYGAELGEVNYKVLQIPYKAFVWNLGTKAFIDYAHKYNIAVQYWTINDADDVKTLVKNGADAIMTDYPSMAYNEIN